jgi:hypothetical protein
LFSNFVLTNNNNYEPYAKFLSPFLDKVMNKNSPSKKNDDEKVNGTEKHRFNAEYSDELTLNSKKDKKISKQRADERLRQLADLH